MKTQKLTGWMPISTPPVRIGVYNVSCQSEEQSGNWYSYWDGEKFNYYGGTPNGAELERNVLGCGRDTKSWRGIAK